MYISNQWNSMWNQNVLFLFISIKYSNAFNSVKSIGGFNVKFRVIAKKNLLQRQMYLAVKSIIWLNVIWNCRRISMSKKNV